MARVIRLDLIATDDDVDPIDPTGLAHGAYVRLTHAVADAGFELDACPVVTDAAAATRRLRAAESVELAWSLRKHRATFRAGPAGTWQGGCTACGVGFGGEKLEAAAQAWCMGHDAAVNRARHVAATHPPFFAPTGPGEAITLPELRRAIDVAATCLELLGHADVEVLVPADVVPFLHLFTPPIEDGWQRTRLGGLYIERAGEFIPAPSLEAWAG